MKGLLTLAALAAGVAAALAAVMVLVLGWHVPGWTLVAVPCAAAFAAFLIGGRLRAIRLRRRRRERAMRVRRPEAADYGVTERVPSGSRELDLVPVRADEGRYQR